MTNISFQPLKFLIILVTFPIGINSFPRHFSNFFPSGDEKYQLSALPILLSSTSTRSKKLEKVNKLPPKNASRKMPPALTGFLSRLPSFPSFRRKEEVPPPTIKRVMIDLPTSILPKSTIETAATRSQLLGSNQPEKTVPVFVSLIRAWYKRNGYPLHTVSGANITNNGDCVIHLYEPKTAADPVQFLLAKEMVQTEDGVISLAEERKRRSKMDREGSKNIAQLNTTFVMTDKGRTRAGPKWYKGLDLTPGSAFRWSEDRYRRCVLQSGIFKRVLKAEPVALDDGTVQLQIIAEESPSRNLEYGVASSLYTGAWEGEIDFQHGNLFGSGESAGVKFRRAPRDPEPSVRVHYKDDKFGFTGGYLVSLFNDFIGDEGKSKSDADEPLLRRGATFQFLNLDLFQNSRAKIDVERVSTRKGRVEGILGGMFEIGPYAKDLGNSGSRASWSSTLDLGGRFADSKQDALKPYAGVTATTKHLIPMTDSEESNASPVLAFEHMAGSSLNLPKHEAQALGIAAKVRGYPSNSQGSIKSFITGKTEIRLPFDLPIPFTQKNRQDGTLVLFADWSFTDTVGGRVMPVQSIFARGGDKSTSTVSSDEGTESKDDQIILKDGILRKSGIGIGLRKIIQGIPLKYDITLTQEGTVRNFFGIGFDFNV